MKNNSEGKSSFLQSLPCHLDFDLIDMDFSMDYRISEASYLFVDCPHQNYYGCVVNCI